LVHTENRSAKSKREDKMPNYDIVLKTIEPLLVAGRRIIVTENDDHPVGLPEAFEETYNYVQEHGKQASPCIAVWYTCPVSKLLQPFSKERWTTLCKAMMLYSNGLRRMDIPLSAHFVRCTTTSSRWMMWRLKFNFQCRRAKE